MKCPKCGLKICLCNDGKKLNKLEDDDDYNDDEF